MKEEYIMNRLARFVKKYSTTIIIFVLFITVVMGYFALQIEIEAGIKDMLPKDNKVVKKYNEVQETFGGMAFAAIMIEDDEIIDTATLKKIKKMNSDLEKIDG